MATFNGNLNKRQLILFNDYPVTISNEDHK